MRVYVFPFLLFLGGLKLHQGSDQPSTYECVLKCYSFTDRRPKMQMEIPLCFSLPFFSRSTFDPLPSSDDSEEHSEVPPVSSRTVEVASSANTHELTFTRRSKTHTLHATHT